MKLHDIKRPLPARLRPMFADKAAAGNLKPNQVQVDRLGERGVVDMILLSG